MLNICIKSLNVYLDILSAIECNIFHDMNYAIKYTEVETTETI